jgi:preprotein translocase subunit SecG
MTVLLYSIHILTCLFLILVVLLQQGKGADLSVFGGGGTMTAFGARGAASLLHKMTVGGFVLFIVTTLTIGVFESRDAASVMSGLEAAAAEQAAEADEGELTATEGDAAEGDAAEGDAAEGDAAEGDTGDTGDTGDAADAAEGAPAEGGDAPAEAEGAESPAKGEGQ